MINADVEAKKNSRNVVVDDIDAGDDYAYGSHRLHVVSPEHIDYMRCMYGHDNKFAQRLAETMLQRRKITVSKWSLFWNMLLLR